mmetsp:Transcript_106204/g.258016  ORF Transcript_106204/g.258016 Transcript_106204/m.258016 type:complete len:139 (+) Transcript_106204:453-869(+)
MNWCRLVGQSPSTQPPAGLQTSVQLAFSGPKTQAPTRSCTKGTFVVVCSTSMVVCKDIDIAGCVVRDEEGGAFEWVNGLCTSATAGGRRSNGTESRVVVVVSELMGCLLVSGDLVVLSNAWVVVVEGLVVMSVWAFPV